MNPQTSTLHPQTSPPSTLHTLAPRSILTDEYMRVKGSDGSIFAFGDSSTIYQPKAMDYAERLFEEVRGTEGGRVVWVWEGERLLR
jgi:hypothetical protein